MGKDLSPVPGLATDWQAEDDGHNWTFHLVKGVKWHSDGKPFTAADVKFTIEYIKNNKIAGLLSYVGEDD